MVEKTVLYNLLLLVLILLSTFCVWKINKKKILVGVSTLIFLLFASALGAIVFSSHDFFGSFQLLAWALFIQVPIFLLGLAIIYFSNFRRLSILYLAVSILIVGIGIKAFFIEPYNLQKTEYEIFSNKVDSPIRVAIIADIQTDSPGDFEEKALAEIMKAKPDLILFPGDFIQHYDARAYQLAQKELNSILKRVGISAPLGAYAVQGNVDWERIWLNVFQSMSVTTIEATQSFDLGPLFLTGLSMFDSFQSNLSIQPQSKFHIVFGHSPNFSLGKVQGDLLIAGHTHGGQVQLPFIGPLITLSLIPRYWAEGLTKLDSTRQLIVSRGIGMERGNAPRLRLFCPPEIILVDIKPIVEGSGS